MNIVEIDGKQYKVEPFCKKVQEAFVAFMRFHELSAIKQARESIGDDDYFVLLRKHLAHASYDQKFGSPHFYDVVANPDNLAELLWYAFSKHQEVNKAVIAKWIENDQGEAIAVFAGLMDGRERDEL